MCTALLACHEMIKKTPRCKHTTQYATHALQGMLTPGQNSPIEDDDLVSQVEGLFLVVCDQDAGHAHLVNDALQPLPD